MNGSPNLDKPLPHHQSSTRTSSKLFEQPEEVNPWATSTPSVPTRAIYVGPPDDLLTLGSGAAPPKLPQRPSSHASTTSSSNSISNWGGSTTNAMFGPPRTPTLKASSPQQELEQTTIPESDSSPRGPTLVPKSNNPFSSTSHTTMIAPTSGPNSVQNPFAPPIPNRPPPIIPSFSSPSRVSTSSSRLISFHTPNYVTSPISSTPDYFGTSITSPSNPDPRSHNPTHSPHSSSTRPFPAPTEGTFSSSPSSPLPSNLIRASTLLSADTGEGLSGTPTTSPAPVLGGDALRAGTSLSPASRKNHGENVNGNENGQGKEKEVEERLRMEITRLVQESMKDLVGAQDQVVNLFEAWKKQDSPRPSTSGPSASTSTIAPLRQRSESPDHETATFLANFPELDPDATTISSATQMNTTSQRSIPNLSFHTLRAQNQLINTLTAFLLQQTLQSQSQSPSPSPSPSSAAAIEEHATLLARAEQAEKELERGEFERRREGERVDRERVISGEKLINMKSEIERLRGQAKKDQEEHSENLENATLHAGFLQERINVLEQALNDIDSEMAGNSSRNQRDRDVEEAGDNIWREIVDQQTDLLGNHTKALATLTTSLTCGICSELMNGPTTLLCGHSGCLLCFQAWFARGNNNCPECRKEGVNGGGGGLAPAYALMDVVRELKGIGLGEGED